MSSELAVIESRPLTVQQLKANINLIQEVMRGTMQNGVHYGTIPGCGDKPALLKPGAEKIMATFRIAADPEVEDLSTEDEVRYRVRCRMLSAGGSLLGTGVGECSSSEMKYRWRKAICEEEFNETPEDRRRGKWCKGRDGNYQERQVRTAPADVANTVLKMAKKRALVDGVLTATAASDIFTQDVDEDDVPTGAPPIQQPQRKAAEPPSTQPQQSREGEPLISDAQRKRFYAIWKGAGKTEDQVRQYMLETYGVEHSSQIPKSIYNEVCAWADQR